MVINAVVVKAALGQTHAGTRVRERRHLCVSQIARRFFADRNAVADELLKEQLEDCSRDAKIGCIGRHISFAVLYYWLTRANFALKLIRDVGFKFSVFDSRELRPSSPPWWRPPELELIVSLK